MATSDEMKERIAVFARELGEADDSNALSWLDALETQAVAIGDAVGVELLQRQAQHRAVAAEQSACPQCGKLCCQQGQRERQLLGRRGPVTISEPEYHCPACRRAFFPSDSRDRG